jgi:hypothetical protein
MWGSSFAELAKKAAELQEQATSTMEQATTTITVRRKRVS